MTPPPRLMHLRAFSCRRPPFPWSIHSITHPLCVKGFQSFLAAFLVLYGSGICAQNTLPPVVVTAPVTLPAVIVRAPTTTGGAVLCTGSSCADIIDSMRFDNAAELLLYQDQPLSEEDNKIDKKEFCERLKRAKPASSCGSTAPVVPLFSSGFAGNGCGPSDWGPATRRLAEALGQMAVGIFSGDLNAPFPGVSFLDSCNRHDACYSTIGTDRGVCDSNFGENMRASCAQTTSGSTYAQCDRIAALYRVAVSEGGQSSYDQGQAAAACAQWHFDMEQNQCPK